ncbi:LysE family translocator [Rubrobacter aplysinae]|uniref:LysE family translocator n=1 Tax=Rubrobacter aplysinae TaxID=909625 RepID=UPI00069D8958|nr:LysE family translocator [Rubrobacter aplysinae]
MTNYSIVASLTGMSVEFVLTSLIVALVPGTGVVYTISSAIGGGWRSGLFATVGCTLGIVPHIMAAMLGLSALMQAGSVVFEVVRWAGVAYLVYLGVSMILAGGSLEFDTDENSSSNRNPVGLVIRRGILLNLLNPKLTLFFFAFLPQFLGSAPSLLDPRLVGLGAAFMAVTFVVFLGYASASAAVRDLLLGSATLRKWFQRSLGALLVAFAARLALTER